MHLRSDGKVLAVWLLLCGSVGCGMTRAASSEPTRAYRTPSPSAYEHYLRAQLLSYRGDHTRAVAEYQLAAVSDSASPELHVRLAEELSLLGRHREAEEHIERAQRMDPDNVDVYLAQADLCLARHDRPGASSSLRRALAIDEHNEAAYLALARVQTDLGDPKSARRTLETLVAKIPSSIEGRFQLAEALALADKEADAMRELREVLARDASYAHARLRLSELLIDAGKQDDALQVLEEGLVSSDDRILIAEPLVELLIARRDLAGARDVVAGLDADPSDPAREVVLAELHLRVEQPAQARQLVTDILRRDPNLSAARLLSGELFEEAKDVTSALAEYRRIRPDAKEFVAAVERSETVLRTNHRAKEARDLVEESLRQRPNLEELVILAARVDAAEGDPLRAVRRLKDALSRQPQSESLQFHLAVALDHSGDWRRALETMRLLLKAHPDLSPAMNFVGYIQADHGVALADSEQLLRQALRLDPKNGYILDSLGWCLFKEGKLEDARQVLDQAAHLVPKDAEILRHLGDVYLAQRDRKRAVESYRAALDHGSPDERLRRALEETLSELEAEHSAHSRSGIR